MPQVDLRKGEQVRSKVRTISDGSSVLMQNRWSASSLAGEGLMVSRCASG
jgi:hypothetical protein